MQAESEPDRKRHSQTDRLALGGLSNKDRHNTNILTTKNMIITVFSTFYKRRDENQRQKTVLCSIIILYHGLFLSLRLEFVEEAK